PLLFSQGRDAGLDVTRALADSRAELLGLAAKLVLGDSLEAGGLLYYHGLDRLNALALPIVASSEHIAQQPCQRHVPVFLRRTRSASTIEPSRVDESFDALGHESLD